MESNSQENVVLFRNANLTGKLYIRREGFKNTIDWHVREEISIAEIFLVDDEEFIIELYKDILQSKGHKIVGVASDGDEAVQKYKELGKKPVIVIMDQRMPVKDGVTATQEILKHDPHAKILFGSADLKVKPDAMKAGAKDFLLKPFRMDVLLSAIDELDEESKHARKK